MKTFSYARLISELEGFANYLDPASEDYLLVQKVKRLAEDYRRGWNRNGVEPYSRERTDNLIPTPEEMDEL